MDIPDDSGHVRNMYPELDVQNKTLIKPKTTNVLPPFENIALQELLICGRTTKQAKELNCFLPIGLQMCSNELGKSVE